LGIFYTEERNRMLPDAFTMALTLTPSVVANIATDMLKHYAQRFDGTRAGQLLKVVGIIGPDFFERMHAILVKTIRNYFESHPDYSITGVELFLGSEDVGQSLASYILDRQPIDPLKLHSTLSHYFYKDPIALLYIKEKQLHPEQIIPDFLDCYRQTLRREMGPAHVALLLDMLDLREEVLTALLASETRLTEFITQSLAAHAQREGTSGNVHPTLSLPPTGGFNGKELGSYRLSKLLMRGRFGDLYLAEHRVLEGQVIMKILPIEAAGNEGLGSLFALDERTLVSLSHPYLLPVIEVQKEGTVSYVVLPYVPGGSLRDRIRERNLKPFSLQDGVTIISQIGQALAYLHEQHIVHRGLQPESVLFSAQGEAILGGLDLAIEANGCIPSSIGTAAYRAPEQFEGQISTSSDQYALGCIAYELFAGRHPFASNSMSTPDEMGHIVSPRQYCPDLPLYIEQAILKAMSVDSSLRFPHVLAFVVALTQPGFSHIVLE
jgi:hypothetical protein